MSELLEIDLANIEALALQRGFAHPLDTLKLVAEVRRLRAGKLTTEEFQTLCHNLHERGTPCTRQEFERGCREFQDKLFGVPPVPPGCTRPEGYGGGRKTESCCECSEDYPSEDLQKHGHIYCQVCRILWNESKTGPMRTTQEIARDVAFLLTSGQTFALPLDQLIERLLNAYGKQQRENFRRECLEVVRIAPLTQEAVHALEDAIKEIKT